MITNKFFVRNEDDVVYRSLGDEAVLLHFKSGNYYTLNDVGILIWDVADGKCKVQDIIELIFQTFDVERDDVEHDVTIFLEELAAENLIVLSDTLSVSNGSTQDSSNS